jgi:hypothetical protein
VLHAVAALWLAALLTTSLLFVAVVGVQGVCRALRQWRRAASEPPGLPAQRGPVEAEQRAAV